MSTAVASPAAVSSPVVKTVVSSSTVQGATFTTKEQVLNALAAGTITVDKASTWLKEHENANSCKDYSFYVKANPIKGTVSVYGVNRLPVTLFPEQWRALLGESTEAPAGKIVLAFLVEHADYLPKRKGDKPAKTVPAELIGEGKPFRHPKTLGE